MQWYYSQGTAQHGPLTETEFKAKISSGEISDSDMVWKEGMADWMPLSKVPEFQAATVAPPPVASPVATAPVSSPAPAAAPYNPPMAAAPASSGLAIASLICGIISLLTCGNAFPVGIAAIICGHMALGKISVSQPEMGGRGLAMGGLICGYLSLLLFVVAILVLIFSPELFPYRLPNAP